MGLLLHANSFSLRIAMSEFAHIVRTKTNHGYIIILQPLTYGEGYSDTVKPVVGAQGAMNSHT